MLSKQEEQAERVRTLENDRRLRDQGGTFLSHTHSDLGGRFSAVGAQTVVGADPFPNYPAASAHQHDPCGQEPPLGYEIDRMPEPEPSIEPASSFGAQATGPTSDAPSTPLGQHGVGPLSENMVAQRTLMASSTSEGDDVSSGVGRPPSGDPAVVSFPSHPAAFIPNVDAGSLPTNKFKRRV
jgi:hypothetical protein